VGVRATSGRWTREVGCATTIAHVPDGAVIGPHELPLPSVDAEKALTVLVSDRSHEPSALGKRGEPGFGDALDRKCDGHAIEPAPLLDELSGIAADDLHIRMSGEQMTRTTGEPLVDLDGENGSSGRHHVARQRGPVAGSRSELGDAVTRGKAEDPERKQIGVRGADGRETLVVEEERCVRGAFADVARPDEALARHLEEGGQHARFERTCPAVDLDDEVEPSGARMALEIAIGQEQLIELRGGRPARTRRVPSAELAEPLARMADIGRDKTVVHLKSLCIDQRKATRHRSQVANRQRCACLVWRLDIGNGICFFPLDELARHLFADQKAAYAVAIGVGVREAGGWTTEIGTAGRLASGATEPSVSAETWFDLASLTKPVTAMVAVRLVRAGKLALGAPLVSLLPEVRGTASENVSLELLLAHRAGLASHRPLYRDLQRGKLMSRRDALREAASARRSGTGTSLPPGGFSAVYSDLGYLLAGEALARASGTELDELVEREVIGPLGAHIGSARRIRARDASFDRRVAATEIVAWRGGTIRGAVHDENAWAFSGDGMAGHAGLFGTAAGVLRIGAAVVDILHGRAPWFLSAEEFWPLVMPRPEGTLRAGFDGKSEEGSSAGTRFGKSTIGHLGFTGTSFWCDVDREMVGVVLTNRVHPTRDNDVIRHVRPLAYDRMAEWAEIRRRRARQ